MKLCKLVTEVDSKGEEEPDSTSRKKSGIKNQYLGKKRKNIQRSSHYKDTGFRPTIFISM